MKDIDNIKGAARGRWKGLLASWLDERALSGKHGPCPMCGGTDRFRLDDRYGDGDWICSHCGAGDGFDLLENINHWNLFQALQFVEQNCGRMEAKAVKAPHDGEDVKAALQRVWTEAKAVEYNDPAWLYLNARCGITVEQQRLPSCLRFHPALPYYNGKVTRHPALLAQVVSHDGKALTIHRTYLTEDGKKAHVESPKKLMTPIRRLENVAIRLAPPKDGWLGVAEGIETALCASAIHGVPVWACVTAGLLRTFRPNGIDLLTIFGDNDASYAGQSSAYVLAEKVTNLGEVEVRVAIPQQRGDWADEFERRKEEIREAG